jgi:HK97 family phage portal protein
VITRVRGRGSVELRAFALTDMVKWGYDGLRNVGGGSSETQVRGLPAINRAARMRAEALGSLKLRCWQGEGAERERVDGSWQARLFVLPPNEYQTRFGFWETIGESLAYRGNGFIWKNTDPLSGRVVDWYALHPDQVDVKGHNQFKVLVRDGYVDPVGRGNGEYYVSDDTVLHIRGHGNGGTWEAPSPIAVFRDALAAPVARQRHESRMWRRGTALQVAVAFPAGISKEQADEWKPAWQAAYEGTDGATTAVLGGGAEIKPIGMTLADAQFVEMAHLTVEDAARIMGVPANLLGAQLERSVPNLEQDLQTWLRFGLGPELERIESHLSADEQLFPPLGRSVYPMFDSEGFVRGDVLTEDTIAHQQVQDGRLLVDEWRASQGLPPLPGGAGKVPQVTPVGGAPANQPANGKVPATNGASNE